MPASTFHMSMQLATLSCVFLAAAHSSFFTYNFCADARTQLAYLLHAFLPSLLHD